MGSERAGAASPSRPTVVLAAVTLTTLAYVLVGFFGPPPLYDEGVSVYGAVRVLDGHLPYRDFWTMYAPGQFYLLAALFKLFGVALLVERLATAAIIAASGALVYAVAARLMPPGFAFLASALWTSLIAWIRFYGNAMPTAMLAILVAWWALLAYFRAPTAGTLAAAGGAVGLATLFATISVPTPSLPPSGSSPRRRTRGAGADSRYSPPVPPPRSPAWPSRWSRSAWRRAMDSTVSSRSR